MEHSHTQFLAMACRPKTTLSTATMREPGARSAKNERRNRAPLNRMVSCASHSAHEFSPATSDITHSTGSVPGNARYSFSARLGRQRRAGLRFDVEVDPYAITSGQSAGGCQQHRLRRLARIRTWKQHAAGCALIEIAHATDAPAVATDRQHGGAVSALMPYS